MKLILSTFFPPHNSRFSSIKSLTTLWKESRIREKPFSKPLNNAKDLYIQVVRILKQTSFIEQNVAQKTLSNLQKYLNDENYLHLLSRILVPANQKFKGINQLYLQIAENYLTTFTSFEKQNLSYIIDNIERITLSHYSHQVDDQWLVRDYLKERKVMKLFLNVYMSNEEMLNEKKTLLKVTQLCKFMNIYQPKLSEKILLLLRDGQARLKLKQVMALLIYLSRARCFPNEIFYSSISRWLDALHLYPQFSKKKTHDTLKYLELIALEQPPRCEYIQHEIMNIIEGSLDSIDKEQLARSFFFCTKLKFGIGHKLLRKFMRKIGQMVKNMEMKELCLVTRGFSKVRIPYLQEIMRNEGLLQISEIILLKLADKKPYEQQILRILIKTSEELSC